MAYLEDGEWLNIDTNPDYSGNLISVESSGDDNVLATDSTLNMVEIAPDVFDISEGWARSISTRGDFSIVVPRRDILSDWQLELNGLPRMYDRLNFDAITDLFGKVATQQIHWYQNQFGDRRESVGDSLAKHQQAGPLNIADALSTYKSRTVKTRQNINKDTLWARYRLYQTVTEENGRFTVARTALIND